MKTKILIESGIAIPKRNQKKRQWKNLAEQMKSGDSVLISQKEAYVLKQAIRLIGYRPIQRSEDGKLRIWKTKKN